MNALNILGDTIARTGKNPLPSTSNKECEDEEECFDITQNQFSARESGSLSTGLPPLNVVPTDVECDEEVEECFDITQRRFPVRTKSLSTGMSPFNIGSATGNSRKKQQSLTEEDEVISMQPDVKSQEECEEDDDECFDITQSRFPARTKSLSTGLPPSSIHHNDVSKEVKDFLPPRNTKDHYDITQNLFPEGRRATSTFSNLASGNVMQSNNGGSSGGFKSGQYQETAVFDITQHLFPEKTGQALSAFDAIEKSEMNSRPPPQFMDGSSYVLDINKRQISKDRSFLPLLVNTGTVKPDKTADPSPSAIEFESSYDYVDITKQHFKSDRSSFTQLVNSGTKKDGTTYGSWDESRLIPTPERAKDASWRFRRTTNNEYLDRPQFSPDLSPPSFGKPGLSESRQQISGTVNIEPKQRFNTSEANYRDVVATFDRRPLSATANAAVEKRFNTSAEVYRDAFASKERPPLSSSANAMPKQRFNTISDAYKDPQSSTDRRTLSSIAHAPSQQRFITSEQGYRDNSVLSGRQPFNINAAPEQRFKTKEQRKSDAADSSFSSSFTTDNAQPLSLTIHSSTSRFNTVTRRTLFTDKTTDGTENEVVGVDVPPAFKANIEMITVSPGKNTITNASSSSSITNQTNTSRAPVKAEPPLSQTIHSISDRFNITRKSSSSFATQTVGFDMPPAFIKNIDMVTTSEAKNGKNTMADEIKFSSNLSSSTTAKDCLTKQTHNKSSEVMNPDDNQFSSLLSESTSIRDVRRSRPGPKNEDAPLVDENRFSQDLTRVSNAKHKPGSNLKSTPHMPLDESYGIDLNIFSEVSDLCPPSKPRKSDSITQTTMEDVDQLLDLSSRKTVNTVTKVDRGASAILSDDPFVDVPRFSQPETLMGPLRVKNLTAPPIDTDDLGVDRIQFSPTSKFRPPSQVRYIQRKSADKQPQPRAPHINPYFYQLTVDSQSNKKPQQRKSSEFVSVDQFLDLSSQHTVNNSSMTALGQHAIMSKDPYIDITRFSNPESFSPPSKVKTYAPIEDDYFDITQRSIDGSLTRNVSSVRDAIAATKKRANDNQKPNSLLRNVSSVRDAMSSLNVQKEGGVGNAENFESPEDEVRHWLLLRLPYLDKEKIVTYTEQLIEDGFDSNEMLGELIEEDIGFMEDKHKESLAFFMDLKYWFLAHLPHLEESDIEMYSRQLVDDGFDSFEMIDELKIDDLNFMKSAHRRAFLKHLPEQNEDAEASFDITRDSFRHERPSLASDPDHHSITSSKKKIVEKPTSDDIEESFDITRASFRARSSLATDVHLEDSNCHEQPDAESAAADASVSPKSELYQFYIEKGLTVEQASDMNDFYTVLENNDSPYGKKFTSIFTCPISGEHFLAGYLEGGEVLSDGHAYWYSESCIFLM